MTEETKKARKHLSPEERKAALAAQIKAIDERQDVKDKKMLILIVAWLTGLAKKRPTQPQIGQAATLVTQAVAAIKAEIPK